MSVRGPGAGKALIADYAAHAGPRLPLLLALMIAGAIAEGLGILMLVPVVAAAIDVGQVPAGLRDLAGWTEDLGRSERLLLALAAFVLLMSLRSALLFVRDRLSARLAAEYEASLKLRAAATLAGRGWTFASGVGQGGMQSLLLTDIPRSAMAVHQAQTATVAAVILLVQFALTILLSWQMAGVAFAIVLAGLAASRRWVRAGSRSGLSITAGYEQSSTAAFRLHSGLKAALAQGTTAAFLGEYARSLRRLSSEIQRFARDQASVRAVAGVGSALAAALLLFIGDRLLELPFPVLVTLLVLFARMSAPALSLQQSLQSFAAYAPAFAAIGERIGTLLPAAKPREEGAQPLEWTTLRLDGVSFEHRPGLGLRDVELTVGAGEWIGVSGPSGSGKTTLADVIAGLLEPQSGQLLVDGERLGPERLERWRAALAYVAQNDVVFDDSIRGNLLAGGGIADDTALCDALDAVGLAERVRSLPSALESTVGERGSHLSGGERQRLALARALLRRPSLLILDEATNALDEGSERQVLNRLRSLVPRPAAIVVAHSEGTLALCDRRIRIVDGGLDEP